MIVCRNVMMMMNSRNISIDRRLAEKQNKILSKEKYKILESQGA